MTRSRFQRRALSAATVLALALLTAACDLTAAAGTGNPGYSGDGGDPVNAKLYAPAAVEDLNDTTYFIADTENRAIRRVKAGVITTVIRTGLGGPGGFTMEKPGGIAIGGGFLYFTDMGLDHIVVAQLDSNADIVSVAKFAGTTEGFSGDGGNPLTAKLKNPTALAVDENGTVYVADTGNNRIRRIKQASSVWTIDTIAGTGVKGFSGDAGPATSAKLSGPMGIAVVPAVSTTGIGFTTTGVGEALLISDTGNNRVRELVGSAGYTITSVVGTGKGLFNGDTGLAKDVNLKLPQGLEVTSMGWAYVADTGNSRIRRVFDGGVSTSAFAYETTIKPGGRVKRFLLKGPQDVAERTSSVYVGPGYIPASAVLIADAGNNRIGAFVEDLSGIPLIP